MGCWAFAHLDRIQALRELVELGLALAPRRVHPGREVLHGTRQLLPVRSQLLPVLAPRHFYPRRELALQARQILPVRSQLLPVRLRRGLSSTPIRLEGLKALRELMQAGFQGLLSPVHHSKLRMRVLDRRFHGVLGHALVQGLMSLSGRRAALPTRLEHLDLGLGLRV